MTPTHAGYHSRPVGTSGARLRCGSPGVLSFIDDRPDGPPKIDPTVRGGLRREQQAHLPLQGRSREAPRRARRDGLGQATRGRPPDPRRQGARRPHRERRVRGRQERAGVRRGPDPDARGAHQERHHHRREPLDRPRPDRLDRRGREAGRQGERSRSSARPRPSPPRAGSRTRARSAVRCSARRRARRSSCRSRPATSPTRSSASPDGPREGRMDWADELRGPGQRTAGRQRLEDAVGDGPRRSLRGVGHPRRHRARAARQRPETAPLRRRRPRPDGRPGAADPGRDRPRDGRPLAHVPDPAGDCHASYARHFAGLFIDTFAGLGIHPDATTG